MAPLWTGRKGVLTSCSVLVSTERWFYRAREGSTASGEVPLNVKSRPRPPTMSVAEVESSGWSSTSSTLLPLALRALVFVFRRRKLGRRALGGVLPQPTTSVGATMCLPSWWMRARSAKRSRRTAVRVSNP